MELPMEGSQRVARLAEAMMKAIIKHRRELLVGKLGITSDEYLPLVLKISRMGAVSISNSSVFVHPFNSLIFSRKMEQS